MLDARSGFERWLELPIADAPDFRSSPREDPPTWVSVCLATYTENCRQQSTTCCQQSTSPSAGSCSTRVPGRG